MRACRECIAASGWDRTFGIRPTDGAPAMVWVACESCNQDGKKKKPDLCDDCGLIASECGGHVPAPDEPEPWKPVP